MQVPICGPPNARTKPDLFTPGSIAHSPGSNSRDATFRAAAWVGPSIIRSTFGRNLAFTSTMAALRSTKTTWKTRSGPPPSVKELVVYWRRQGRPTLRYPLYHRRMLPPSWPRSLCVPARHPLLPAHRHQLANRSTHAPSLGRTTSPVPTRCLSHMVHVGHFGLHHMFHLHYVNGHPVGRLRAAYSADTPCSRAHQAAEGCLQGKRPSLIFAFGRGGRRRWPSAGAVRSTAFQKTGSPCEPPRSASAGYRRPQFKFSVSPRAPCETSATVIDRRYSLNPTRRPPRAAPRRRP